MMVFLTAALVSSLLAYPIFRGLIRLGSRQTVSQYVAEHAHKQGTPTMGGLIIIAGFLVQLAVGIPGVDVPSRLALAGLVVGFALIGFADDFVIPRVFPGKRGFGWGQKLVLQFVVAGLALAPFGADFSPERLGIAVVVVIAYANAFNFADGLDWLAGSILVAFGAGLILMGQFSGHAIVQLTCALLGAAIPFLVLNRPKAKIFMGDVGSMPIGGLLGLFCLTMVWPEVAPRLRDLGDHVAYVGSKPYISYWSDTSEWIAPVVILSLVLAAELIPVPLQILSVKLRKKRLFPMTPIHHAFQKAGMKETRVVAWFFLAQVVCTLLAVGPSYLNMRAVEESRREAIAASPGVTTK